MKRTILSLLLLLVAGPAMSLGLLQGSVQDKFGNVLPGTTITVFGPDSSTTRLLFSDRDGTTAIANPISADTSGKFKAYVAGGYCVLYYSGSGVTPHYDVEYVVDGETAFDITEAAYGAIAGDGLDDTPAIQAAHDAAAASTPTGVLMFPEGDFDIYSTVEFTDDVAIRGAGLKTQIISHITDGSAVLENVAAGQKRIHIEDISIVSSDPDVTGNWIGLNIDANRGFIKNVRVRRAATGIRLSGFIWDLVNVWAYYCDVGFHADEFNSIRANINTEVCSTGVIIEDGGGINLTGVCEDHTVGMVVDGVSGMWVNGWFEGNSESHFKLGETSQCKNIDFTGSTFGGASTQSIADNVDGIDFGQSRFSAASNVYLSENVRNVRGLPYTTIGAYGASSYYTRNLKVSRGPHLSESYFINPYFRDGLRGYDNVVHSSRDSLALDATNTISGGGLKVVADNDAMDTGNILCYIQLGDSIASALDGKTVLVGGWVYIPDDDTSYPDSGADGQPDISASYYDGSWNSQSTASQTWTNDGWTFFCRQIEFGSSITDVRVELFASRNSGYAAPTGMYATFSGVFLVEAPADVQALAMGHFVVSPRVGTEFGRRLRWPGAAKPTDTDQTYLVGDEVVSTAADTTLSYVCTVAGSPGTWKYRSVTLEP